MSYRHALHGPTAVDYTRPQSGVRKTTSGPSAADVSTVVGASAGGIAAIIAAITGRSSTPAPAPTATPEATGPDYASEITVPSGGSWVLPAVIGGVVLVGVLALVATKKKKPVTANRRRRSVRRNARRAPRVGTRVRFDPEPVSLAMYGYKVPRKQEEGTVTTVAMPGGRTHHLKGPGGGLVYVNWDESGFIGVSLWDVMPLNQSKQVNWGGRFVKGGGRVTRNKKRDPLQVVFEPAFGRYAVTLNDEVIKRFAERDQAHAYADSLRAGGRHTPMTYQQSQPGVVANRRRRVKRNGREFHFDVYNEDGQPLGSATGAGYVSALARMLGEPVTAFEALGTIEPGTNIKKYRFGAYGSIQYYVSRRLGQYTPHSLNAAIKIAKAAK